MHETIKTLYGNDEILKTTLEIFDLTKKTIEGCIGKEEVAMHVSRDILWNGLVKLKQRGITIRIVTQVTNDNRPFCKTFSQAVELRHVDGIQSSFGISDGKWLLEHVISLDEFPLSHAILTNIKKLVDAKMQLFETVWKQSMPAQKMFAKLEESNPAEVNTQLDPNEAKKLLFTLISNSKYHVDMIIPTSNCVYPLVTEGLGSCVNTALNQGVKVRILLPKLERSFEFLNDIRNSNIEVKQAEDVRAKRIMVMVDSLYSLVMELKEAKQGTLKSMVKSAVYSTGTVALMTFTALFEKMWT